jgi:hypothetical protein
VLLITVLVICIISIVAGISYYLGYKGYKVALVSEKQTPSAAFPTQIIRPTAVITLPQNQITLVPSREIAPVRSCPLQAANNSNLFTSVAKGICFYYAKQGSAVVPPAVLNASEVGTKVYVYEANNAPTSGQSVEVFQKDPADTLAAAIQKKFLVGIDSQQCYVNNKPNGNLPANFVKATIGYPVPPGQANFEVENNCPANYRETNGMAYFLMDANHPDRFMYFSIGQYAIESATGNQNSLWQDTIQVF